jgi:excisionase family DNA binding protein
MKPAAVTPPAPPARNRPATGAKMEESRSAVLIRPAKLAIMLDLSVSSIYEKIARGELPAVRVGRSVRVPLAAIKDLLEFDETSRNGAV